jgi:hypothetical protein
MDKFTMWIEAWPISVIKSEQAVEFFLDIIHHFGVPNSIITDNGTQFTRKKFLKLCDDYHIHIDWAIVVHPPHKWAGQAREQHGPAGHQA